MQTATEPTALPMLTILRAVEAHARSIMGDRDIKIARTQTGVYFYMDGRSKAGQREMISLRDEVAAWILENIKDRKFTYAKVRGHRVWTWYVGNYPEGLGCGLRIVLTDEEDLSILRGPIRGVNHD